MYNVFRGLSDVGIFDADIVKYDVNLSGPQLMMVDCSRDGEALAIEIPEGVVTGETPRRSQKMKVTPKQYADYIGKEDLD